MDTQTTDLTLLREELTALRKEVEVLRSQRAPAAPAARATEQVDDEAPQSNRRGFLKLAGAAAAGATVAAVAGSAQQAAAADPNDVVKGIMNFNPGLNATTGIACASGTALDDQTFRADNWSSTLITIPATHRVGIAATVSGVDPSPTSYRTGLYARTSGPAAVGGQGVFGSHEGVDNTFASGYSFGVFGSAEVGGYGVMGYTPTGTNSTGVIGRSDAGTGVVASSFTGVSLLVRDGGRMQQQLRVAGAPAAGTFSAGEQIRDANGDLYICVTSGTPGTWRKVTAQHPAYANSGGSINMLSTPIRLFDTRPGTTAPLNNGFVRVAGNTILTLQITGTSVGGISVPAGAKGILGNITVIQPAGDGYAQVWPSGGAPTTSNLNYSVISANPAIANSFICGLEATGKVNILTYQTAHVLFDVAGFVY